MSGEPFYIRQTGDITSPESTQQWFKQSAEEAKQLGAICARFSVNDIANPTIALVEAWNYDERDQGKTRWQVTETKSTDGNTP